MKNMPKNESTTLLKTIFNKNTNRPRQLLELGHEFLLHWDCDPTSLKQFLVLSLTEIHRHLHQHHGKHLKMLNKCRKLCMKYINQKKEQNILLIYVYIINILNLPHVHTTYQCKLLVQNYPSVKNNKKKK